MRGYNKWSYSPYKPLLTNTGDIYICRIVPYEHEIHFEWLNCADSYKIYYKKREASCFIFYKETSLTECDIIDLETETDYEFYVEANNKKSRIRLARTGKSVGIVVNYLHPEDKAYSFSGQYLCSPSLVVHPDGYLLASMDLFAVGAPQNLTLIFRSDDNGNTWHYVSELMPAFWGRMFLHKGKLYMLACSTEYGDLLIGESTDGGKTFCAPVSILRGSNGKQGNNGVHKNPENIFIHNGRLYVSLEWGAWANKEYGHAAMIMCCDVDSDLMNPENWFISEPVKFDDLNIKVEPLSTPIMTIEGTIVLSPQNELLNIMRFGVEKHALIYKINEENPELPLQYKKIINFDANLSKFIIKYDDVSKKYYTIASRICNSQRNLLSLMVSEDLENWTTALDILDYRHCKPDEVGFQYVDYEFVGDDILFLCRTAINKAHNFHDSNYTTFHRIENFRDLVM